MLNSIAFNCGQFIGEKEMKYLAGVMTIFATLVFTAPVQAAQAVQTFLCEEGDGVSEDKLEEIAAIWIKAARTMKGGENLQAHIHYPIVAKMPGNGDFLIVLTAPSFAEWGIFWDGYKDSPAEMVDTEYSDVAICPDSALWESVEIK